MRVTNLLCGISSLVCLACAGPGTTVSPPAAGGGEGAVALFNGRDLAGWEGDPKYWTVEDGAITGVTTRETKAPGPTYLIWRGGAVDDFELRFRYRLFAGPGDKGNSGVQYRSKELPGFQVTGYQADMETEGSYNGLLVEMGGPRHFLGKRGEKTRTTADGKYEVLASLGDPAALDAKVKRGDWNEYVITARGSRLVHTINGHVMTEVTDEHPTAAASSGVLALQLNRGHVMRVQFKDIELRRLRSGR